MPGRPTIWIIVGQWPIALAVGADGRCLDILRGWSGGAKVLGKLPVPGRPTNLGYIRARSYCACNRCGWGTVWTFFLSSITFHFFLPLFCARKSEK